MSHVIKEVAGVLGITLKHATTKNWAIWAIWRVNQTNIEDWDRRAENILAQSLKDAV